jgi:NAD(P)-dependent dehydrogenase (short-subunit alcohol dehydrogenase family)
MNLDELCSLYDLTGRTALMTGGTGVLGREIAAALYGCNANLVILGRNAEAARKLIESFPANTKARAIFAGGDVLDKGSLGRARERVIAEFGPVDILINAAGGNAPAGTTTADQSFFDLPLDGLEYVQNLNLFGTILPCQVFGRDMAERGEGVILNVSSMSAYRALTRIPAYSAAKAAVTNFTQWLAVHMAQNYSPRIRVNAIAPGFFITEQNRFLLTDKDTGSHTARGKSVIAHTPMNRFGTPEDLLGAVMWLVSPASAFVTGAVIPVDGGFSAFGGV